MQQWMCRVESVQRDRRSGWEADRKHFKIHHLLGSARARAIAALGAAAPASAAAARQEEMELNHVASTTVPLSAFSVSSSSSSRSILSSASPVSQLGAGTRKIIHDTVAKPSRSGRHIQKTLCFSPTEKQKHGSGQETGDTHHWVQHPLSSSLGKVAHSSDGNDMSG